MKAHFFIPATIAVLLVTGCSAEQPTESVPEPVTVTSTVFAEATDSPTSAASAHAPEPAGSPAAEAQPATQTASQVGGFCGTVQGEIEVEAFSATSCEFAMEMYNAAINATFTMSRSDPTTTAVPAVHGLKVSSPITRQTYTIDCFIGSAGDTLSCKMPGDETVGADFRGTTGAYWYSDRAPVQV